MALRGQCCVPFYIRIRFVRAVVRIKLRRGISRPWCFTKLVRVTEYFVHGVVKYSVCDFVRVILRDILYKLYIYIPHRAMFHWHSMNYIAPIFRPWCRASYIVSRNISSIVFYEIDSRHGIFHPWCREIFRL